ncbi:MULTISPECIES: RelA/SpoT family protein [Sphingobacterium]|uniref:Bifunctional (P)ppGpp synthetase/guanosine-3',5'-bis(Diphosphate) 3'-pyrophosphohydrolase n=1 Tax=Sphingobacterium kitahiroshimense TaxID=470446 RepID=A0ABV0BXK1_9SPHI|nr:MULTISPECIES: bifunctional (p)ppGpp synthetase/guanosine-3',5'-bis(diphosphate) 3'-pyrophosphohydrolase [Sphingobacterium]MBB2950470.1 GTP pyrophosphokinase [Sphingobacterium sp. JUb56]MCS3552927.1 GTP pyrophosphokinase [Sphingobacterium sp. JUb21]MCW2259001.1 GTP pyrophosphokinase [Sphingobacterium kitahiroshimense]NJI72903.1 bifunctional (p)ppGpp synthetase/guanosine-3',5'-bis(diphosphate) 3'-pyrophosphohydrolase [Sphingobacterium sp. B16(2022)]QQD12877.1 bifunctional (p)ppGpp synthetase/
MKDYVIDIEAENKEIRKRYRALLRACKPTMQRGDKQMIRKAFDLALESHKEMRRKSGEPYIFHPIAVAQIAAEEIGLGTTSIVCALLHDVVEDTNITLDEIEQMFGKKVRRIIDGLTKISGIFDPNSSMQAENFRKMLLTLADDVRVILIKLADRLHNMRTMEFMARDKQLKIASETSYLYAPLAHRLGLYAIKSELEDLSMKFTDPDTYKFIARKLNEKKAEREKFISDFIQPVQEILQEQGITAQIFGRPKSIHSIWTKMRKKSIPFEEVYDLFAIRIVIDTDDEREKTECWKVYSIVTDLYRPNPDRLRDWVSSPKGNGYESLHTTVMGPRGQWVEVQIRTSRMNEIAEKGFAAHWKYKESNSDSGLDQWIKKIRDVLSNPEQNALDFVDDFKMNLFSDEIFIFTPKGALIQLPHEATALDFAFEIHSDIGATCIGAKVNHKLVPLSHVLQNGDQVEIITSSKQTPKEDWLNFVVTAKAKSKIRSSLKEERRRVAEDGKEILERKLKTLKITYNTDNINKIANFLKFPSSQDLFYNVAKGLVDIKQLREFVAHEKNNDATLSTQNTQFNTHIGGLVEKFSKKDQDTLLLGDDLQKIDYTLAPCCNPIPGDDVFGFLTVNDGIKIHRTSCPNASKLMANYGYRIMKAKWTSQTDVSFLTGLRIVGIDDVGLVNKITTVISQEFKVNIRSLSITSNEGIFEGHIMVFVNDTEQLENLMKTLKQVRGITTVSRYESES